MKLRFGEIVRADYKPGLHIKAPFYHEVHKFERRITTRNYPSEQFLTSEGKILRIDFYIKWRIFDVSKYYTGTGGSEDIAAVRLGSTVKDAIKGVIARRTIQQVVAAERTEFTGEILKSSESKVARARAAAGRRARQEDRPARGSERVGVPAHAPGLRPAGEAAARRGRRERREAARRGRSPAHRDPGAAPTASRRSSRARATPSRRRPMRAPTRATRSSIPSTGACRPTTNRSAPTATCW